MTESMWENQRSFIPGRWGVKFIATDPPPWTTHAGEETQAATAPFKPIVDASTDEEGWVYASDFHALQWTSSANRHCFVRRRRWASASCQASTQHSFATSGTKSPAEATAPPPTVSPTAGTTGTHGSTTAGPCTDSLPTLPAPPQASALTASAPPPPQASQAAVPCAAPPPLPAEASAPAAANPVPYRCPASPSLAPSVIAPSKERARSVVRPEAQSVSNSLDLLLHAYGFDLDREHFLLDGCNSSEGDDQLDGLTKQSIPAGSVILPQKERQDSPAATRAHPMALLDRSPSYKTRSPSLSSSKARLGLSCRRAMESVYFMDTASRPDVPDTVWAIDTVQAVEGLTRAASDLMMEGSTQLQAGSTGDTLWLDKPVCFNDTVANSTSPEGSSELLHVPTIVSSRTPAPGPEGRGLPCPIAAPILDTEPALSDDERSEGRQSQTSEPTSATPGKAPPDVANGNPADAEPLQLVMLRIQHVSPPPPPSGVRYFVRARLQPSGGWVDSGYSDSASWLEAISLCPPAGWTHLELRLCAVTEAQYGAGSPTPSVVGHCDPVPLSRLANTPDLRLPLTDLRGPLPPNAAPFLLLLRYTAGWVQWVSPAGPLAAPSPPATLSRAVVASEVAGCVSATTCHCEDDDGCGPPRLEVTVLSAEHLLTKADALARPSAPEVYVAMTLPDLSPGWYRSGARDALWAVWNETLSLPVPCEAELTVLEVHMYTSCDEFFLGQALVPLHDLQAGHVADFTVRLGLLTENGGFLASCTGPPRQLSLRISPRRVRGVRPGPGPPLPPHFGWRFDPERQAALLCRFMRAAAALPRPRPEGFLPGHSLHVLEVHVEGLDGVAAAGPVALELRVAGVVLRTQAVEGGPGGAFWGERFLVELEVGDPLRMEVVAQVNGIPAGEGRVDLTRVRWDAGDRHVCPVRLLVGPQVVAVVGLSLEQRPAGGLAALVAAQRGHRMLAAEWEAAWQCGLALEAEARRALFGAWEGVHRRALLDCEERQWAGLEELLDRSAHQLHAFQRTLCSIRIRLQRTARLGGPDACQLRLRLGRQTFATPWATPSARGTVQWCAEGTLQYTGTLEGDCKVLREPLEVALWRGDRRCGAVAVSLAGLHWRQQRRCAVPLPDGSATALTLEALDFGLPPANEDEGEELVAALPMHVVRENGLPVVPSPLGVDRLSNDLHTPLRGVPQPSQGGEKDPARPPPREVMDSIGSDGTEPAPPPARPSDLSEATVVAAPRPASPSSPSSPASPASPAPAPAPPPPTTPDRPAAPPAALTLGLGLASRPGFRGREELVLQSVRLEGPAAAAGLQAGDVVVAWGGAALSGRQDFVARLQAAAAGRPIALEVVRRGRALTVEVVPALATAAPSAEAPGPGTPKSPWSALDLLSPRQRRALGSPQRGVACGGGSPRTPSPSRPGASPLRPRDPQSPSSPAPPPPGTRRVLIMTPRTQRILSPSENRTATESMLLRAKAMTPPKKGGLALGDISNAPSP